MTTLKTGHKSDLVPPPGKEVRKQSGWCDPHTPQGDAQGHSTPGTLQVVLPFLPGGTGGRRATGYRSGCRWPLLRATRHEAQAHSFQGRRACHVASGRPTLRRCQLWMAMLCGQLRPLKCEAVGGELLSAPCKGSHLLAVRLADAMSGMALG